MIEIMLAVAILAILAAIAIQAYDGHIGEARIGTAIKDIRQAEIILDEPENVLTSGIEIRVRPPGKELRNMALLSGGERSLTTVALLFSIYQTKPPPFCLLDEVDAALDDANVGRFNEIVKEMAEASQFLVITHNKRTIEICDTLYGVTMEDRGVSSLVSVELH